MSVFDFSGKPPPKCKNCGHPKQFHHSKTASCPQGRRHRTHGFPYFSKAQSWEEGSTVPLGVR